MLSKAASSLIALSILPGLALAADAHGATAQGTVMGPVAFLWPSDRPWSESQDNIGPCGSSYGVGNRTTFPLGSAGAVSFSIADEAYNVALRIAYGNNPTTQAEFSGIKGNVSEIEPGHQCYGIPASPSSVTAGSNATIQLEYWANDSNKNESFFACADITFVEAALFTTQIPCFNVTSAEFEEAEPSSATTPSTTPANTANASAEDSAAPTAEKSSSGGGLSGGAKAGIAIAAIAGAAFIAAGAFFVLRKKRATKKDAETGFAAPEMMKGDAASFKSGDTAVAK
ncbi:hypothetical protein B0O99DRAFT_228780 [Bisporella sp. PMI_857]|nr:hypothetical protein B0O99DRAFT_228780 [Bisporella sp. PMI_857]